MKDNQSIASRSLLQMLHLSFEVAPNYTRVTHKSGAFISIQGELDGYYFINTVYQDVCFKDLSSAMSYACELLLTGEHKHNDN